MKYFIVVIFSVLFFANCFDSTQNNQSGNDASEQAYIEKGKKIAMMTFASLSGNLQKAMKEGGVDNAVGYCNVAASPLVDSLEKLHQAEIKRTSLKVRNPKNKPSDAERQQLEIYQKQFEAGKEQKPVIQKIGNQIAFYTPIHMMPLCEKCHGKVGAQLKEKDYEVIKKLYPTDSAINYKSGDLRGMWSISFKK